MADVKTVEPASEQGALQKGLTIPRRWTRPTVPPYDEITWELRSATIGNEKGEVVFEQKDVEVPAFWSQLATNVVVSKYFRGALGTPQRERSVKQLIGRVANTIAGWGIKDGYFATAEDAEAFRAELTSLLVNQVAAFNSPVWFNVGIEPKPQCSACFILSVDDNMESILEWYRNEGMIFKYGSGAGLNVSNLRSARERLAGGGTASGPVSFMRAADASAGVIKSGGKCFKEGTLVATPGGWKPIESLRTGDLVLTHEGPRAVADFMPNGPKQCYRVRSKEGYEVEVTAGHKFAYWNAGDGRFETRPIEHLTPGDSLYLLLASSEGGQTIPLVLPESNDPPHATTTAEMRLPTKLAEEFAYILGLMYGDGELRTTYPYRVRVTFGKNPADQDAAARFIAYSQRVFGETPILLGDEAGHQQLGFTRKRLIEFLVANGIAKGKAAALRFPQQLFQARPEVRSAFIAGVIDADGSYQPRGGWYIASIDREFLVSCQRLLLTLGIPSKIKLSRPKRGTWQPLYRLCVVGHTFVERLAQRIAPHSSKARLDYVPSDGADKGWGYRPSLYAPLVARVERRGGYRLVERTVGSTNETTGYGALAALAVHPDATVASYAQELSHCVQVTLESIESTEVAETYDIEVEGVHLLSANGFYASNTRRAAKMVVLNADHPDVKPFILCKWKEEEKAHKLIDVGYDASIDGEAYGSVFFQNANNSVRATDDFMKRALADEEWDLKAVTTGEVLERVKARELLRLIAEATWHCGDPGMQFDTTVNDWHTVPNTGRINASNPCFTGDAMVYTDKGLVPFKELHERAQLGERFRVFTHNLTNPDRPVPTVSATTPTHVMCTGTNEVYQLRFSNGVEVKATANHRFFTTSRGMVAAKDLQPTDEVMLLDQPVELLSASLAIDLDNAAMFAGGGTRGYDPVQIPRSWTAGLAEYVGYLVGDGSVVEATDATHRLSTASVVFGNEAEAQELLPRFETLFAEMGVTQTQTVTMPNGTMQFRVNRTPVVRFLKQLGVAETRAPHKRLPHAIFQTSTHIMAACLRGLFTADGCVYDGYKSRYVGLGSTSRSLLIDVQRLLLVFGIHSRIYKTRTPQTGFPYQRKDGTRVEYTGHQLYDLRISGPSIARFKDHIGFLTIEKQGKLDRLIDHHEFYRERPTVRVIEMTRLGYEATYNLTEPTNHSYIVNGLVVANCSEYMSLDNSACNLASINLLKFLDDDGNFLIEQFKYAVRILIIAQDIIVDNSSYPTPKIERTARDYRQLGLGYANLGALLMSLGVAYDSEEGRAWAGAITTLLCGHAYEVSGEIAEQLGPYAGFARNHEPQVRVLRKHRAQVDKINHRLVPAPLLQAATRAWDASIKHGEAHGVRNSQVTVIAPTGTIAFLMDCDTTGIEPDIALVKYKRLVGGGMLKIVNQTVPKALKTLGYEPNEIEAILKHINDKETIEGAPGLKPEHLPIFDCAFRPIHGTRSIHYMGHIRMMGAVQPFISGAISKTVNLPQEATIEDIMQAYTEAWRLGIKAIAIYRDGSKRVQPLSTSKDDKSAAAKAPAGTPYRRRQPDERQAITHKFSIGGHEGYLTVGLFEDGQPGEIFIVMSKEGSTLSGVMDCFATTVSLALQYGVPLKVLVNKFSHVRFEPSGVTNTKDIRFAKSVIDYIFRWMALKFLPAEEAQQFKVTELPGAKPTNGVPAAAEPPKAKATAPAGVSSAFEQQEKVTFVAQADAPVCADCGSLMVRNGACYKCLNCGSTSGCS